MTLLLLLLGVNIVTTMIVSGLAYETRKDTKRTIEAITEVRHVMAKNASDPGDLQDRLDAFQKMKFSPRSRIKNRKEQP